MSHWEKNFQTKWTLTMITSKNKISIGATIVLNKEWEENRKQTIQSNQQVQDALGMLMVKPNLSYGS